MLSPSLANGTQNTLPNPLLLANLSVSTLAAPAPSPGFAVDVHYAPTNVLNPLGVYMSAINSMYHFAQSGWNKRLSGGFTAWAEPFDVEIDVEAVRSQRASLGLQTSHIVVGLYQTILEVSDQSRFCEVLSTLSLQGRQIGSLAIQKRISGTNKNDRMMGFSSSNEATYPSGQIDDVDDPPFTVSYRFAGIRINSKDIFMAALDALATAAQFPANTPFRSLNAISASGDCVISIAVDSSQSQLSYSYVTKALRGLISSVMFFLRKFEEITFQLNWRADKMVEGSIRMAGHGISA